MEQLDDRLTAFSNQQKRSDEACADSLSEMHDDIGILKTDVDKKTSSILSKSQTILEKVKGVPDLVRQSLKQTVKESNEEVIIVEDIAETAKQNDKHDKRNVSKQTNTRNTKESSEMHNNSQNYPPKAKQADLTLITGSYILRGIETKFLAESVRVKSFKAVKIETLKEALTNMDLTNYKNIVLHVGGNDVDSKISTNSFREKYASLIEYLKDKGVKVYVSGLLPRGQSDVKPYNNILKNLCEVKEIEFIDNHDSFILASGKLPVDFFLPDRINLKFLGTRALVHNIHEHCIVLPKRDQSRQRPYFGPAQKRFGNHNQGRNKWHVQQH